MSKAKRRKATPHAKPARGPRGKAGATGPPGPAGPSHALELESLAEQVSKLAQEHRTQLTRIGQIQAQLDRLASGSEPLRRDDHATEDTEH